MNADPRDIDAAVLEVFRRSRAAQTAASAAELARPGATAEDVAAEAWGRTDALAAASPAKPRYACAAGCSSCCHQPVLIAAPEALAIAGALRESYQGEDLIRVGERLAERARGVGEPDWDRRWLKLRLPCAFLARDGRCGIHVWRPTVCRGYHSLSRQACEDWHHGISREVPIDRVSHLGANGLLHGLLAASAAAGRSDRLYELHGSILFALSDPEAEARWTRGEEPFPGLWSMLPATRS